MIGTVVGIRARTLRRDRAALLLTFVLPVVFFAVFAWIFGGMGGDDGMPTVRAAVVDEDASETSRRITAALLAEEGLAGPGEEERPRQIATREEGRQLVLSGEADLAIVLPKGFGAGVMAFGEGERVPALLLADTVANPVARPMVEGLLQKVAMTAAPDLYASRGIALFERHAGELTPSQREAVERWLPSLGQEGPEGPGEGGEEGFLPVAVESEDVRPPEQGEDRRHRIVAFYAAGIGVMFLLFSMMGAAGVLLEEEEMGTLERVLASGLGMGRLLGGYWLFATLLGGLQLTVMFAFGWAVFGLELWTPEHLAGFVVMTAATAAAAAAFGLILATACRTRAQLSGVATIVILLMSAVGGSMVPRFILRQNPVMDKVGLLTFNAWAIDGYQKVFWYETGLASLWPQVLVLALLAAAGFGLARLLARRWEAS